MPKRNWKSNPLIGLGLVAIIIAAGWLTYQNVGGGKTELKYSYVLKCTNRACTNPHPDRIYVDSHPKGQKPPFSCPYCGGQAYIALRCRNPACGRVFALPRSRDPGPPYDCPYCERKRTVYPLEPGQISLTDVSSDQ